jgi:Family of unknown function (DUF5330)
MVNAGFPAGHPIWFRNGGCGRNRLIHPRDPAAIKNLRRIQWFEFFENSRQFNFNANTCDLSTAVSERIVGSSKGDRSRKMRFLLRLVFWIGLVLVLLPRDKTPESDKTPQLSASEAVSAATAAVSDMSQFCKRQPAACDVGGQAATVIGQRAQAGARRLYQIITDKRPPDHTGSIGGMGSDAALAETAAQNTLSPDDLQIDWRGATPPMP